MRLTLVLLITCFVFIVFVEAKSSSSSRSKSSPSKCSTTSGGRVTKNRHKPERHRTSDSSDSTEDKHKKSRIGISRHHGNRLKNKEHADKNKKNDSLTIGEVSFKNFNTSNLYKSGKQESLNLNGFLQHERRPDKQKNITGHSLPYGWKNITLPSYSNNNHTTVKAAPSYGWVINSSSSNPDFKENVEKNKKNDSLTIGEVSFKNFNISNLHNSGKQESLHGILQHESRPDKPKNNTGRSLPYGWKNITLPPYSQNNHTAIKPAPSYGWVINSSSSNSDFKENVKIPDRNLFQTNANPSIVSHYPSSPNLLPIIQKPSYSYNSNINLKTISDIAPDYGWAMQNPGSYSSSEHEKALYSPNGKLYSVYDRDKSSEEKHSTSFKSAKKAAKKVFKVAGKTLSNDVVKDRIKEMASSYFFNPPPTGWIYNTPYRSSNVIHYGNYFRPVLPVDTKKHMSADDWRSIIFGNVPTKVDTGTLYSAAFPVNQQDFDLNYFSGRGKLPDLNQRSLKAYFPPPYHQKVFAGLQNEGANDNVRAKRELSPKGKILAKTINQFLSNERDCNDTELNAKRKKRDLVSQSIDWSSEVKGSSDSNEAIYGLTTTPSMEKYHYSKIKKNESNDDRSSDKIYDNRRGHYSQTTPNFQQLLEKYRYLNNRNTEITSDLYLDEIYNNTRDLHSQTTPSLVQFREMSRYPKNKSIENNGERYTDEAREERWDIQTTPSLEPLLAIHQYPEGSIVKNNDNRYPGELSDNISEYYRQSTPSKEQLLRKYQYLNYKNIENNSDHNLDEIYNPTQEYGQTTSSLGWLLENYSYLNNKKIEKNSESYPDESHKNRREHYSQTTPSPGLEKYLFLNNKKIENNDNHYDDEVYDNRRKHYSKTTPSLEQLLDMYRYLNNKNIENNSYRYLDRINDRTQEYSQATPRLVQLWESYNEPKNMSIENSDEHYLDEIYDPRREYYSQTTPGLVEFREMYGYPENNNVGNNGERIPDEVYDHRTEHYSQTTPSLVQSWQMYSYLKHGRIENSGERYFDKVFDPRREYYSQTTPTSIASTTESVVTNDKWSSKSSSDTISSLADWPFKINNIIPYGEDVRVGISQRTTPMKEKVEIRDDTSIIIAPLRKIKCGPNQRVLNGRCRKVWY